MNNGIAATASNDFAIELEGATVVSKLIGEYQCDQSNLVQEEIPTGKIFNLMLPTI